MKSLVVLALALVLPSTAATATAVRQKEGMTIPYGQPLERKAGCTRCSCCDFITVGGLRIPIGFGATGTSRRD